MSLLNPIGLHSSPHTKKFPCTLEISQLDPEHNFKLSHRLFRSQGKNNPAALFTFYKTKSTVLENNLVTISLLLIAYGSHTA